MVAGETAMTEYVQVKTWLDWGGCALPPHIVHFGHVACRVYFPCHPAQSHVGCYSEVLFYHVLVRLSARALGGIAFETTKMRHVRL